MARGVPADCTNLRDNRTIRHWLFTAAESVRGSADRGAIPSAAPPRLPDLVVHKGIWPER